MVRRKAGLTPLKKEGDYVKHNAFHLVLSPPDSPLTPMFFEDHFPVLTSRKIKYFNVGFGY